jgi:GH25 family lysozyme M1 (1,4-beta-N-acetylmuramidase)
LVDSARPDLQDAAARADGQQVHRSIRGLTALVLTVALVAGSALAAGATTLTGPDVSSWNHPGGASINWNSVRAAGHTFAFVKATQGPSVSGGSFYTNPYYASDSAGARAAGLYVGAYDFAVPALPLTTAALQARAFVSVVGSLHGTTSLPPVLDLEQTGGLSSTNLRSWVQSWLTEAQRLTGRTPTIYTSPNFWKTTMGNTTAMSGYHLWLASWTSAKTPGVLPGGWSTWTMWQYTDVAKIAGITGSVDLNRYCCTSSNLAGLANGQNDKGASNPFGTFDGAVRAPGTITVDGWAIDPDTTAPLDVHVYVDGKQAGEGMTGVSRPDVATSYPGWGVDRGYEVTVSVAAGSHEVCVYGINQLVGTSNSKLGCRTVSVAPIGALQSLTPVPGGIRVQGWVSDPDSADPASVHVYVDDKYRVAATGTPRSFSVNIGAMSDGPHTFCVYGIDNQRLANSKIGCRTATVAGAPMGNLDSVVAAPGGAEVVGWAIDPDTTDPITVNLYVDGVWTVAVTADTARPDVGDKFVTSGPLHGLDEVLALTPGSHEICAYAINTGLGASNKRMGCKTVG